MVWYGISLEARTELCIIPRGSLTAVRYTDEILHDFVVPYANFIGNNLILMHKARPQTARITQQYLNDVDIDVLEWPACHHQVQMRIQLNISWAKNTKSCSYSINLK
nr:unnamed protein product [Callosobruchus chinensis]